MITKEQLEKAEFNALFGGWVEKELFRRLKATYKTEQKFLEVATK